MNTPIFEAAKVTGGAFVPVHDNWCRALDPQPGPCSCTTVDYKVVRTSAKRGGAKR